MTTGIVLAAGGGVLALAGLALTTQAQDDVPVYCDGAYGLTQCGARDNASKMRGGVGMLIGGGVAIAAGIPLAIWGAARAPASPSVDAKAPSASALPTVSIGAGSGSMRWTF